MKNLTKTSWEVSITSPKSGRTRSYKKYWSKKQGVAIVGDNTDGAWSTLMKLDGEGKVKHMFHRDPMSNWLRTWMAAPEADRYKGLKVTFVKDVHCCYCSKNLTHPESERRGYGPVCADKYGLEYDRSYTG